MAKSFCTYGRMRKLLCSLVASYAYLYVTTNAQFQNSAVCRADFFGNDDLADLNARNSDQYIEFLDPADATAQQLVTDFFDEGYVAQGTYDTEQFGYSPERLEELSRSHAPFLYQIGHDTFEVINGHVQIEPHHSTLFFVLDQNENIVAIFNTSRDFSERETYSVGSLLFRVDLSNSDASKLTPYMSCNLHHNWEGHSIEVVDPVSWNRTLALAVAGPHEACIRNRTQFAGETYFGLQPLTQEQLGDDKESSVGYSVYIPPYENVFISVENETYVRIEMDFRAGMFLAVGFTDPVENPGNLMFPADMVVCREHQGKVRCDDYYTSGAGVRDNGPSLDFGDARGTSNLVIVEYALSDSLAHVVLRKPIKAADPSLDVNINVNSQNLIFARSQTTSTGGLLYHGVLGRFQRFNINLQVATDDVLDVDEVQSVRDLQVVHGMMMFVFWGVNIVIGGAIARYYKNTKHWFQIHKFFQLVNTFLTIPIFLLTLGFVPEEGRFRTTHGKMGYFIVFLSIFQAFLGNTSHVLNKISKGLFNTCERSDTLSPEVLAMIESVKPIPENVVKKRRDFFENWQHRRSLLSQIHMDEVDKIVNDYLKKVYYPMSTIPCCLSMICFFVKHVNQQHMRKLHRWQGRCFLFLAVTQIALGLKLLEVNTSVEIIIWTWVSLCLLAILYKEIERFCELPVGMYPKLIFAYNSCCNGELLIPGQKTIMGEETIYHKHKRNERRFSTAFRLSKRGANRTNAEKDDGTSKRTINAIGSFDSNLATNDINTDSTSFGSMLFHSTRLKKSVTEGAYPQRILERLKEEEAKRSHEDIIELSIQDVGRRQTRQPSSMIIESDDGDHMPSATART